MRDEARWSRGPGPLNLHELRRSGFTLPQVSSNSRRDPAHLERLLREPDAWATEPLELGVHVVDDG